MNTTEHITELKPKEVIVFGSNLAGNHAGGLALQALKWGAVMGEYEGLEGQTYAFPTLDEKFEKLSQSELKTSRNRFYRCAIYNPQLTFLLTKVGMGIAGFSLEEIKPLFEVKLSNIIYPQEFI